MVNICSIPMSLGHVCIISSLDSPRRNDRAAAPRRSGTGGRRNWRRISWRCATKRRHRGGSYMGMDQYLLIPFLVGWTSIYQLFWCSPGVQGFDTLPYVYSIIFQYHMYIINSITISQSLSHFFFFVVLFVEQHDTGNYIGIMIGILWYYL